MKQKFPRWLNFGFIFVMLVGLWLSMAAAVSPNVNPVAPTIAPIPGPGNSTFGLIIGAILIVTIIVARVTSREQK